MKRIFSASGAALAVVLGLIWFGQTGCKTYDDQQIKSALEIVDMDTSWTMKDYRQWPNPKLTLVPTVTFKLKNNSAETLSYINVNAIFKELNSVENLGDCFRAVVRGEGLGPGQTTPPIVMKSNFGVAGTNLESFKINPQWRTYYVKMFVQMGGPRHVPMGEWRVSRRIDFQEDKAAVKGQKPAETPKEEPAKK
ncbi:MAG: hypothetical protein ACYDH3_11905 [Candidatus Aminicenantales bacterium]